MTVAHNSLFVKGENRLPSSKIFIPNKILIITAVKVH